MAYVSKELKKELAAAVKKVLPADWKATFKVRHNSTFVVTIRRAPSYVIADSKSKQDMSNYNVNLYYISMSFGGKTAAILHDIKTAANLKNYDNSDAQTDYFDVGYYVDVRFGEYDNPCEFV